MKNYFRRLVDVVVSSALLIIISPYMLIIAILLKLGSQGGVIDRQMYVGLDGKEVISYRFRTMKIEDGSIESWATKSDPRITALGRILRANRLDELPNLFSVLVGHITLIGPRPIHPMHFKALKRESDLRLPVSIKAGLLSPGFSEYGIDGRARIKKEIEYDKERTLWTDILLIMRRTSSHSLGAR